MSEDILKLAERMAAAVRKGVAVERMWQQKLEEDERAVVQKQMLEMNELSKMS